MKFSVLIILILFLGIGMLSAQEVKVSVVSDDAPVEYAYLFINNNYYGFSDSTGFVGIRRSDISPGDTISVSYIGMDRGAVAYDPEVYGPEGITITLIPNLSLEEVVVVAKDRSRELLKRYVHSRYTEDWYIQYNGDYRISQQDHDQIAGSFVLTFLPDSYAAYFKRKQMEITSASDTAGRSAEIQKIIKTACNTSLYAVQLKNAYVSTQNMSVKYMGKTDGCHVFSLVKPAFAGMLGSQDGFQTLIYADAKSREIRFAKTTLLYSDGVIIELSVNYGDWKLKSSLGGHLIYPISIEGSITQEQAKTHFLIEHNKISAPFTKISKKDRKKIFGHE